MASDQIKDVTVKYVNKDFQSLKADLIRFTQAHFSGAFTDFNETSPGMAVLELGAFVGDVLSFYLDQQFLEMKQETARQLANVENFAKMRGYRPRGQRAAVAPEKFIVEVPATAGSDGRMAPNLAYAPVLLAGSQVGGPGGVIFETTEDLDFGLSTADNPAEIVVSRSGTDGTPTFFAIRREVDVIGASTVSEQIPVGNFVPFVRVPLTNPDVIEVVAVTDSDGNTWREVEYLAQNVVFDQVVNTGSDSGAVPYVLRFRAAPRRFTVDTSLALARTYLQFGPGQGLRFDDEIVPSVARLSLPVPGRGTFTNFSLDPQNFLKTRSLGLSPANTTLSVKYRIGGGNQTNVPAGSIKSVLNANFAFKGSNLDPNATAAVRSSVECINLVASEGGGPAETIGEIKNNAASFFAAQARAVTKEDYLVQTMSMPARFGRPDKAYVKISDDSAKSLDLHILARDQNNALTKPTPTLCSNIQTYLSRLRMITEGVNILSSNIIDVGVRFGVVISPRAGNRQAVLADCLNVLKDKLDTDNMQIGAPLVISELSKLLQAVDGVISVYKLAVVPLFGVQGGLTYASDVSFDVEANTANGIVYCPPNAIFEVRHPESDIVGESK